MHNNPLLPRKVRPLALNSNSYLSVECCKADGTTPLCLGGSTEEQEDTESASATCDHQPQRNNDQCGSYKVLLGSQDGKQW